LPEPGSAGEVGELDEFNAYRWADPGCGRLSLDQRVA
jgi:hypothetical protein